MTNIEFYEEINADNKRGDWPMSDRVEEIRERVAGGVSVVAPPELKKAVSDVQYLLNRLHAAEERVAELEGALKPLARTKVSEERATEIWSRIIAATGNGPWGDWLYDLVTEHAEAAREALTEGER